MAEIKSSLLNADDMKYVKKSLEYASEEDGKTAFRVKTVEYINDSASDNSDEFFYDSLIYLRFLRQSEGKGHIAFTTPDNFIYMVCPDAENGPGEKIRVWDFIYCHECLHQLWDTFGVGDRIKKEGLEYNHMLLNIASDCVINDYLSFYRKKERFENGIFPDVLEKEYGVTYNRKEDTQYSLYLKLLKMKQEQPNQYKKMQDDPKFNGTLDPASVEEAPGGGGGGPQIQHSPDYIKGWTQGIQDTLDGKVDPKTYKPVKPKNDYDQGYNDVMEQIKEGLEKGVKLSKDADGGGGGGSDLPQIPWNTPPQQSQSSSGDSGQSSNQNQSPEDSAKDAQKSADDAQKSASQAQKAADDAQAKADKSGNAEDQQAADDAQKAADKAKEAAENAKDAADKAKEAAEDGDADGASDAASDAADAAGKAAQAAQEASSNAMGAAEASANAQQSADKAQAAADAAEKAAAEASKNGKGKAAEDAKNAAKEAKDAAKAAQEAADKAKEAAKKGNTKEAREAANEAAEKARLAEDAKRIAEDIKNGKYQKSNNSFNTGGTNSKTPGRENGEWPPRFESEEDLKELREQRKDELDKWRKKLSGDLGKFVNQCQLSKELKKDGLVVNTRNRASTGWNTQMNQYINSYVKKRVFQKKRQYESTYSRIKRGSGFVKFGQPILPGRKIKEDKLNIDVAFYIDRSGSMGGSIDQVFKAAYTISDSLKRQFGKDPVVDKTEFKMFAFDMQMHQIKWGNRISADGGTMDFDEILKFITHNTKEFLINVIITDAGFDINKTLVEKFMKDIEGIVLFVTNSPSQPMKELAKKHSTQLFYIEADSQFTLDK